MAKSKEPQEQPYISLMEATKFCQYSQEYLSLRARQGKLKAIKFGRNWVTTREWLQDYIRRVEAYNHKLERKKQRRVVVQAVRERFVREPEPPSNLPVEKTFLEKLVEAVKSFAQQPLLGLTSSRPLLPKPLLVRTAVITTLFIVLIVSSLFGQEILRNSRERTAPLIKVVEEVSHNLSSKGEELGEEFGVQREAFRTSLRGQAEKARERVRQELTLFFSETAFAFQAILPVLEEVIFRGAVGLAENIDVLDKALDELTKESSRALFVISQKTSALVHQNLSHLESHLKSGSLLVKEGVILLVSDFRGELGREAEALVLLGEIDVWASSAGVFREYGDYLLELGSGVRAKIDLAFQETRSQIIFDLKQIRTAFWQTGQAFLAIGQDIKEMGGSFRKGAVKARVGLSKARGQIGDLTADLSQALGGVGEDFIETVQTLKDSLFALGRNLREVPREITENIFDPAGQEIRRVFAGAMGFFSRLAEKFVASEDKETRERPVPKLGKEGLVVIPSSGRDEEVRQKIKESFSDEVRVRPYDEESGIIVPVFREREGQEYLYIMVPVRDENSL